MKLSCMSWLMLSLPVFSFRTFGPVYQGRSRSYVGSVISLISDVQDGRNRCSDIDEVTAKFNGSLCDTVLPDFKAVNQTIQTNTVVMCFGLYDVLYELCKFVRGKYADTFNVESRESQKSSNFCFEVGTISTIRHRDPALDKWADYIKKLLLEKQSCEDLCQLQNGVHIICKLIVAGHRYLRRISVIDGHEKTEVMGSDLPATLDVVRENNRRNTTSTFSAPNNTNGHEKAEVMGSDLPATLDVVRENNRRNTTSTISAPNNTNGHEKAEVMGSDHPATLDVVRENNRRNTTSTMSAPNNTNGHEKAEVMGSDLPATLDVVRENNRRNTTSTMSAPNNTNGHEKAEVMGCVLPATLDVVRENNKRNTTSTKSAGGYAPNISNLSTVQSVKQKGGVAGLGIWLAVFTVVTVLTLIVIAARYIKKKLSSNAQEVKQPLFRRRRSCSFSEVHEL